MYILVFSYHYNPHVDRKYYSEHIVYRFYNHEHNSYDIQRVRAQKDLINNHILD